MNKIKFNILKINNERRLNIDKNDYINYKNIIRLSVLKRFRNNKKNDYKNVAIKIAIENKESN